MGIKLRGTSSNRDGIGARVQIGNQTQEFTASQGYSSSSLVGLHFGLGATATRFRGSKCVGPAAKLKR